MKTTAWLAVAVLLMLPRAWAQEAPVPPTTAMRTNPAPFRLSDPIKMPIPKTTVGDVAAGVAKGLVGGLLGGLFGGGGRERPEGPDLAAKPSYPETTLTSGDGKTKIDLSGAIEDGKLYLVVGVKESPDSGAPHLVMLQHKNCNVLRPTEVQVYDIWEVWGGWRLTVSWTKSYFEGGRLVKQERGGWSTDWNLFRATFKEPSEIPAIWKDFGEKAFGGIRGIISSFEPLPGQIFTPEDWNAVIHVTNKLRDDIVTAPFVTDLKKQQDVTLTFRQRPETVCEAKPSPPLLAGQELELDDYSRHVVEDYENKIKKLEEEISELEERREIIRGLTRGGWSKGPTIDETDQLTDDIKELRKRVKELKEKIKEAKDRARKWKEEAKGPSGEKSPEAKLEDMQREQSEKILEEMEKESLDSPGRFDKAIDVPLPKAPGPSRPTESSTKEKGDKQGEKVAAGGPGLAAPGDEPGDKPAEDERGGTVARGEKPGGEKPTEEGEDGEKGEDGGKKPGRGGVVTEKPPLLGDPRFGCKCVYDGHEWEPWETIDAKYELLPKSNQKVWIEGGRTPQIALKASGSDNDRLLLKAHENWTGRRKERRLDVADSVEVTWNIADASGRSGKFSTGKTESKGESVIYVPPELAPGQTMTVDIHTSVDDGEPSGKGNDKPNKAAVRFNISRVEATKEVPLHLVVSAKVIKKFEKVQRPPDKPEPDCDCEITATWEEGAQVKGGIVIPLPDSFVGRKFIYRFTSEGGDADDLDIHVTHKPPPGIAYLCNSDRGEIKGIDDVMRYEWSAKRGERKLKFLGGTEGRTVIFALNDSPPGEEPPDVEINLKADDLVANQYDDKEKKDKRKVTEVRILDIHPIQVVQQPTDTPFDAWPPKKKEEIPLIIGKSTMVRVFVDSGDKETRNAKVRLTFDVDGGPNERVEELSATLRPQDPWSLPHSPRERTWVLLDQAFIPDWLNRPPEVDLFNIKHERRGAAHRLSSEWKEWTITVAEEGWDAFNFEFRDNRAKPTRSDLVIRAELFIDDKLVDVDEESTSSGHFAVKSFLSPYRKDNKYIVAIFPVQGPTRPFKPAFRAEYIAFVKEQIEQLKAVYPVPDDAVTVNIMPFEGRAVLEEAKWLYRRDARQLDIARAYSELCEKEGYDKCVLVVPEGYITGDFGDERHGVRQEGNIVDAIVGWDTRRVVFVEEDAIDLTVAHELGHTHGLEHSHATGNVKGGWNAYGVRGLGHSSKLRTRKTSLMGTEIENLAGDMGWINLREYKILLEKLTR